jgi:hypothetical protein
MKAKPVRTFCVAVTGALCLTAVSGCDKQQPTPDGSDEVAGETYKEYDERRDSLNGSRRTFADQGCTKDCGGHKAGYAWAEEKGISNPDQCGGRSWSFIEGCRAYAERAPGEGE